MPSLTVSIDDPNLVVKLPGSPNILLTCRTIEHDKWDASEDFRFDEANHSTVEAAAAASANHAAEASEDLIMETAMEIPSSSLSPPPSPPSPTSTSSPVNIQPNYSPNNPNNSNTDNTESPENSNHPALTVLPEQEMMEEQFAAPAISYPLSHRTHSV